MTPIELTEEFLGHLNITKTELEDVRDIVDELAETIVRGFWERHKLEHEQKKNSINGGSCPEVLG